MNAEQKRFAQRKAEELRFTTKVSDGEYRNSVNQSLQFKLMSGVVVMTIGKHIQKLVAVYEV